MGKRKLVSNTSDDLYMPETPRKRFKNGTDGDFQTRMEICVLARRGMSPTQISKTLGCSWDMAKRWSERSEEVMKTGSVKSNRNGNVGPKPIYQTPVAKKKLYKKLKQTTQIELAKELGHCPKVISSKMFVNFAWVETIRRAICRTGGTKDGAFPYRKQKTPQFDDRIRRQRLAYAKWSPVGLAARDGRFDEEKKKWIFWDHTPTSKTGAVNRSHDPCWRNKEDRDTEGVPAAGSSKFSLKVKHHFGFNISLSHRLLQLSPGMRVQFIFIASDEGKRGLVPILKKNIAWS